MPHLAPAAPAALRSAISQLLLALARLDADALWLLLFRLADQVSWHQHICTTMSAGQELLLACADITCRDAVDTTHDHHHHAFQSTDQVHMTAFGLHKVCVMSCLCSDCIL